MTFSVKNLLDEFPSRFGGKAEKTFQRVKNIRSPSPRFEVDFGQQKLTFPYKITVAILIFSNVSVQLLPRVVGHACRVNPSTETFLIL